MHTQPSIFDSADIGGILYNVTVKVTPDIAADWLQWIKEEHINDVVQTGCFTFVRGG